MRILGTVVPFIGFKEIELDDDLRAFLRLPRDMEMINTFQLAWLGFCLVIPLRPKDVD